MLNRRQTLMSALMTGGALLAPRTAAAAAKPQFGDFGVETRMLDRSVAPGEDFYEYVNGGWLKANAIPPDRSRWGEFDRLGELSDNNVRALLEEAGGLLYSLLGRRLAGIHALTHVLHHLDEQVLVWHPDLGVAKLVEDLHHALQLGPFHESLVGDALPRRLKVARLAVGQ